MNTTCLALLAAVLTATLAAAADAPRPHWPQGQRAAVSLAYDDALGSQLDYAIPALDRAGLKASFYLQLSSPAVAGRLADWRAAARNGHELGNHSLFHQCSARQAGWVTPSRDLDTTTVAQMQDQLALANAMLYAIDGQRGRTYTVPCGDSQAADGDYLPAVAAQFLAVRHGGKVLLAAGAAPLRTIAVDAYAPHGVSGEQLIAMVEQAAARGGLVSITFHGIGADHLATSRAAHDALVRYLAAHRQDYWTDTFRNIISYLGSRGDH